MTSQHLKERAGGAPGLALTFELFELPRPASPTVSAANIRAKLHADRGGELTPEERGLLLSLLEEHAPESRGRA